MEYGIPKRDPNVNYDAVCLNCDHNRAGHYLATCCFVGGCMCDTFIEKHNESTDDCDECKKLGRPCYDCNYFSE